MQSLIAPHSLERIFAQRHALRCGALRITNGSYYSALSHARALEQRRYDLCRLEVLRGDPVGGPTVCGVVRIDRGRQCTMLWVPLERNDLEANHPLEQRLKKLQCATRDARPVYDFETVQKGWMEVEQASRRAVEARR